jgi:hypothetical protein
LNDSVVKLAHQTISIFQASSMVFQTTSLFIDSANVFIIFVEISHHFIVSTHTFSILSQLVLNEKAISSFHPGEIKVFSIF